jgi:hypothetical protein
VGNADENPDQVGFGGLQRKMKEMRCHLTALKIESADWTDRSKQRNVREKGEKYGRNETAWKNMKKLEKNMKKHEKKGG